tara:strand:- start:21 stop:1358 length:1338 start_codon:yes stop_codon:yes gene_type:complete
MRRTLGVLPYCVIFAFGCSPDSSSSLNEEEQVVPSVEIASLESASTTAHRKEPIRPACTPTWAEGELKLNGQVLDLKIPKQGTYNIFPLDPSRILIASKHTWSDHSLQLPKGTLWSVACDQPKQPEIFYQRADSDFGHAALSKDGHALFFTSKDGIKRLFLATKTVQSVTDSPPVSELCWTHGETSYSQNMTDLVESLDPSSNVLRFRRGSHCGVSATWISRKWQLSLDNLDTDTPAMRSPRPYSTLTRDVSGQLWVGDGGHCDQPGLLDRQTPGFVFVSRNDGLNWDALPVKVGEAMAHTAIRSIRADKKRPGHLVIHAARCTNPLGTYGGLLYMTRDAGQSWRRVTVKREAGYPSDGGIGVVDFELIDGSIDRIRVWNDAKETFETHTTGNRWSKVDSLPFPAIENSAQTESGMLDVSEDGLIFAQGTQQASSRFPTQPPEAE